MDMPASTPEGKQGSAPPVNAVANETPKKENDTKPKAVPSARPAPAKKRPGALSNKKKKEHPQAMVSLKTKKRFCKYFRFW